MNFKNIPNNKSAKGYGSYLTNFDNVINQKYTYDPDHSMNIITALDIDWCGAELPNSNIDNGGSLTIETTEQLLTLINNMNIEIVGLENNINKLLGGTTGEQGGTSTGGQSGTSTGGQSGTSTGGQSGTSTGGQSGTIHSNAALLDILYANSNGDKIIDSNVLDPSLGYTPIAICVARAGFFDYSPRWMSLKFMTYFGVGKLDSPNTFNYGPECTKIVGYTETCKGISSPNCYFPPSQSSAECPPIIDANGNWNLTELGGINEYAITNITGKSNTDKIISVSNGTTYAANACSMYHTLGTEAGDWYLGAAGEMSMIFYQIDKINAKLAEINSKYPNDCFNSLPKTSYYGYWTSTDEDSNNNGTFLNAYNYRVIDNFIELFFTGKIYDTPSNITLAMLSY